MFGLLRKNTAEEQLLQIRSDAAAYLYEQFTAEDAALGRLDRWTQRRVTEENLAKITRVLESDDPIEHCYQNLVQEIDAEAQAGIFLTGPGAKTQELRRLFGELGISGDLRHDMTTIAPELFADELNPSGDGLDLVWMTIEDRYDRAYVDAKISELLMNGVMGFEKPANDMTDAMRALLYAFHEDRVRRQCALPGLLNNRARVDLTTMVSELAEKPGMRH